MNHKNKYVCVHGHFYQPPRENAWLEVIETQDSAAPFHDWNERINFECYAPNTAARILDEEGYIINLINNYSRISFNFGPTLLSWMENADPETYRAILEADRLSRERYGGHGNALAQVHSHLIMPLANRRDKETQIAWGVRDFRYRFNRAPEGMWLAETAVDTETLELLAEHGIQFTLLAPRQGKAIRRIGEKDWRQLPPDSIDSRRPYLYQLPSGRKIHLFFYHGGIAQGVAFNGLLNNGKLFAQRFLDAFDDNDEVQIAHIATDGESYGHHHHRGEMALADCLEHLEKHELAQITNYGAYLEAHPPEFEVQIHENSSWSCVHGVERWRSNCGCNTGGRPGWTQEWRRPLRDTLNWLRDELIPVYEKEVAPLLKDAWEARNDYIEVLLKREAPVIDDFLERHAKKSLTSPEQTKVLRALEMQRNAMLMFTSCGWFFDEISGIETNQILQYANRAIYYADQIAKVNLHGQFIEGLEAAPSNLYANGAASYKKNVMPARVDLVRVGMHYAASSLFEDYPEHLELFNYEANSQAYHQMQAGSRKLALGRTTVKSKITRSEKQFSFAVLYLGQQNIIGSISLKMKEKTFREMSQAIGDAFERSNLGEVIGALQDYFGPEKFTIEELFYDERRKIFDLVTAGSLERIETVFREIYEDTYMLMNSMRNSNQPVPEAYRNAVQFIVNQDLYYYFAEDHPLRERELDRLAKEFKKWELQYTDIQSLKLVASERIYRELRSLNRVENALVVLEQLRFTLETLQQIQLEPDIWKSQNLYFFLLRKHLEGAQKFSNQAIEEAFYRLGELLRVRTQLQEA